MLKVELSKWRATIAEVAASVVGYMGRRLVTGELELWVRTADGEVFKTQLAADEIAPSLSDLFASADFHEREIAQLLGGKFDREVAPLYVGSAAWVDSTPLHPEIGLASRNQTTWPGAKEPGESNAPGKRRLLPPGVDPATPTELLL